MIVSLSAAVAENRVIGANNDLIWHLPDDMKFFKETTKGHYVIMGRRNFDSIPHQFRPLPGRPNIVLTRNTDWQQEGVDVCLSIEEALDIARKNGEEEAFIIGGGMVYELALQKDLVDIMYLTEIHRSYEGDTFFPEFDERLWNSEDLAFHPADEKHEAAFTIRKWTKA